MIITYPTSNLIDSYLGYSTSMPSISSSLGSSRTTPNASNPHGFTTRIINALPIFNTIYGSHTTSDTIFGVDYPCLVEPEAGDIGKNPDGKDKTVVIIGQDPRRGTSDWWYNRPNIYFNPPTTPFSPGDVVIGLPWAVNIDGYSRVKAINTELLRMLLERGFKVYFTDILKVYNSALGGKNFKTAMKNPTVADNAAKLLEDELNAVVPYKILVLGEDPFNFFNNHLSSFIPKLISNSGGYIKHPASHYWGKGHGSGHNKAIYYNGLI